MSNKQQTAVQCLRQEFIKLESTTGVFGVMYELLDKAEEMEKERMIDFALLFANSDSVYIEYDCEDCPAELTIERPDRLFNETYGGNK